MCHTAQRERRCRHSLRFGPMATAAGGTMREIARWMGRSPGITAAAGNGQVSGGALGAVVVPHRWPFREVQLWAEELVRADRRKDEFLATLAHELRNPLGAIRNAVGLLQREQGVTPAAQRAQV